MSRKQKGKQRERDEDDIIVVESDPENSLENCTDDKQRRSSTNESEVTEHSENWEQENKAQTAEKKPRLKDMKAMLRQMKVAVPEWASDIETWSSDDDDTIMNIARKGAKAAGSKITATVRKSAMIPDDEFKRESTDRDEVLDQEAKAPIPS
ncbi:hypothetical protein HETIRDRAFT_455680 [Heterobasidion irregulare TC 32-1]|uniref:Uncharacterized protein n=1 Tax=Heterobasidion irregulare (strain TC 32-1) TaxID=747525 RepID=W4JSM4_HETIT|nr:uncharacterized protein HETIRDRAFT_455680 [Heterobasidion irregulare TC 32-1]ETW76110.1 hypothetical protein HETIRDRAFT_455680 [Heterobasidion irregulare TC 32-1]